MRNETPGITRKELAQGEDCWMSHKCAVEFATKIVAFCLLIVFAASPVFALAQAPDNPVWPRPIVLPKPADTSGVKQSIVSLRGTWRVSVDPPPEFWDNSQSRAAWAATIVPGSLRSQGIAVQRGKEYAFKTKFKIPADFAGKRIFLRFEGVTGQARVWVNGIHMRDHFGGFTAWDCDITDSVAAGKDAWLTLGVTDTTEGISSFNTGGIQRDVKLVAVPQDYVTRLNIETDFDHAYKDAILKVWVAVDFHASQAARLTLTLNDPQGRVVPLKPSSIDLSRASPETIVQIPVAEPIKWDAEHPNLYALKATLTTGGTAVETVSRNIGFRKIEFVGRRLLVNGMEVKLRGTNHHDYYGPTGRSVTPEMSAEDVKLFRDANFNFIRTSHYPPMEEFLDACDRYGMYVDDEASVAFSHEASDDPKLKPLFLNQWSEQIERDRSHPSVLMWSMGNESFWGVNIQSESDYVHAEDKTRPTIFSFGDRAPGGKNAPYEIYSMHYASYSRDLSGGGRHGPGDKELDGLSRLEHIPQPVLHDEYAHVPGHDLDEVRRDPGVRVFYGQSLKRFWENMFPTEGALGGAIWAGLDELNIEWGLFDFWRREKPELWLAKKAYSPVRIEDNPQANPGSGKPLLIPIKNWFDHTNLNELRVVWAVGKERGEFAGPDVQPHSEGTLSLPARAWHDGDVLNLKFYRLGDVLVDEYNLPINPPPYVLPDPQGPTPKVMEDQDKYVISGADFSLTFSKRTGLITRGEYKGKLVITSGPYLQLGGGGALPEWALKRIAVKTEWGEAVVDLSGSYGPTEVSFELRIDGQGMFTTKYRLEKVPALNRELVKGGSFYRDVGGYWEVGVAFIVSPDMDRLAWSRKGLWSAYPPDHIGRNNGVARREGRVARYLQKPSWPWAEDERDYIIFGPYDVGGRGTNDFRSMKQNIYRASATLRGSLIGLTAESTGTDAVRLNVLEDPRGMITDMHDPRVQLTGTWNQVGDEIRSEEPGASAELTFRGTTVSWLGPMVPSGGQADVYIDGKLEKAGLSLYRPPVDPDKLVPDNSREILFSKDGLAAGKHTMRIVVGNAAPRAVFDNIVTGPDARFVTIGAFRVRDAKTRGAVQFIVDNLWNYPQIAWGNYAKDPIFVGAGYTNLVRVRLSDMTEIGAGEAKGH